MTDVCDAVVAMPLGARSLCAAYTLEVEIRYPYHVRLVVANCFPRRYSIRCAADLSRGQ